MSASQPRDQARRRAGLSGLVRTVVTVWALLGGLVLSAVVLLNVASIAGAAVLNQPVPGDFEMTQVGVAVAAFAFLPFCQLERANVSADIFTSAASPRWIAAFSLLASAVALVFSALMIWRMYFGLIDQKTYGYTTAILQFPHWWAFAPILVSLALLLIASAVTLTEDVRSWSRPGAEDV